MPRRLLDGTSESVGSVAEEAAKLLGALSDWAKDHGDQTSGRASPGSPGTRPAPPRA